MTGLVKIGAMIIDDETGEVIDLPEGADRYEYLTARAVEAGQQAKQWEQLHRLYRRLLLQMLDEDELSEITTGEGQAKVRSRRNRKALARNIPVAAEEIELTAVEVNALYSCAKELDIDLLERGVQADVFPTEVLDILIEESASRWVEVRALRKPAPPVEKITPPPGEEEAP